MRHAISVRQGLSNHPAVADPDPQIQIQAAGPGLVTWRIYDAGAEYHIRTGYAYAAGVVDYPVDMAGPRRGPSPAEQAGREARDKAERALAEIRPELKQRALALSLDREQKNTLRFAVERGQITSVSRESATLATLGLLAPVSGQLDTYRITPAGRDIAARNAR